MTLRRVYTQKCQISKCDVSVLIGRKIMRIVFLLNETFFVETNIKKYFKVEKRSIANLKRQNQSSFVFDRSKSGVLNLRRSVIDLKESYAFQVSPKICMVFN